MESDNDVRNEDEREELQDEEPESDESSEEEEEEEDNFMNNPAHQYNLVTDGLRNNTNRQLLQICHWWTIALALDNVDEFCGLVERQTMIEEIWVGDIQGADVAMNVHGPRFEITEDTAATWEKLLNTLGNISTANELIIGGYNLKGSLMAKLLETLPHVSSIEVFLPWHNSDDEDLGPLVDALSLHPCKNISRLCFGDEEEEGGNRFLSDNGVVSDLIRLAHVDCLDFLDTQFSSDECQSFGDILSSDECLADELRFKKCSFPDGGEQFIFLGIARNTSLDHLLFEDMFHDDNMSIDDELVTSLALNCALKSITFDDRIHGLTNLNMKQLIMNVSQRNKSITTLNFLGNGSIKLSAEDMKEMRQSLQNNYSLESITFNFNPKFRAITDLNKAGRRYLSEDPHSNSKCIAVLAKVKDKLDCLYYHMRENPILCISYCNNANAGLAGTKRKAGSDS